jgi:hypothetical protein
MNVTLVWALPTTRESGKPLAVSDIAHVAIEVSADGGGNWSPVGTFGPERLSTSLTDLDFGIWSFRGTVVDTKGRTSNPLLATLVVEDTTPPSVLLSLEAVPA